MSTKIMVILVYIKNMAYLGKFLIDFAYQKLESYNAKIIQNFARRVIFLEQTIIFITFSGQLSGHNCISSVYRFKIDLIYFPISMKFISRVAKWQRIEHFTPGMYAISVNGKLPSSYIREIKNVGVHYRSRDTSQKIRE